MMRGLRVAAVCGFIYCLSVLVAGLAFGQDRRTETRTTTTTTTTEVRRVSTIIGAPVYLKEDVKYGKIEDFVLSDSGCIEYVVLADEDRYVLVPWDVVEVNFARKTVSVGVTRSTIR